LAFAFALPLGLLAGERFCRTNTGPVSTPTTLPLYAYASAPQTPSKFAIKGAATALKPL
jgi:hypothetical protein